MGFFKVNGNSLIEGTKLKLFPETIPSECSPADHELLIRQVFNSRSLISNKDWKQLMDKFPALQGYLNLYRAFAEWEQRGFAVDENNRDALKAFAEFKQYLNQVRQEESAFSNYALGLLVSSMPREKLCLSLQEDRDPAEYAGELFRKARQDSSAAIHAWALLLYEGKVEWRALEDNEFLGKTYRRKLAQISGVFFGSAALDGHALEMPLSIMFACRMAAKKENPDAFFALGEIVLLQSKTVFKQFEYQELQEWVLPGMTVAPETLNTPAKMAAAFYLKAISYPLGRTPGYYRLARLIWDKEITLHDLQAIAPLCGGENVAKLIGSAETDKALVIELLIKGASHGCRYCIHFLGEKVYEQSITVVGPFNHLLFSDDVVILERILQAAGISFKSCNLKDSCDTVDLAKLLVRKAAILGYVESHRWLADKALPQLRIGLSRLDKHLEPDLRQALQFYRSAAALGNNQSDFENVLMMKQDRVHREHFELDEQDFTLGGVGYLWKHEKLRPLVMKVLARSCAKIVPVFKADVSLLEAKNVDLFLRLVTFDIDWGELPDSADEYRGFQRSGITELISLMRQRFETLFRQNPKLKADLERIINLVDVVIYENDCATVFFEDAGSSSFLALLRIYFTGGLDMGSLPENYGEFAFPEEIHETLNKIFLRQPYNKLGQSFSEQLQSVFYGEDRLLWWGKEEPLQKKLMWVLRSEHFDETNVCSLIEDLSCLCDQPTDRILGHGYDRVIRCLRARSISGYALGDRIAMFGGPKSLNAYLDLLIKLRDIPKVGCEKVADTLNMKGLRGQTFADRISSLPENLKGFILLRLIAQDLLPQEQYSLVVACKKVVLKAILANKNEKIEYLRKALDKNDSTFGQFFWMQRGLRQPSVSRGVLKHIQSAYRELTSQQPGNRVPGYSCLMGSFWGSHPTGDVGNVIRVIVEVDERFRQASDVYIMVELPDQNRIQLSARVVSLDDVENRLHARLEVSMVSLLNRDYTVLGVTASIQVEGESSLYIYQDIVQSDESVELGMCNR